MSTTKCELCSKKIEFREKECDENGLTWHYNCFRCCVCRVPLNENNVKVRGEKQNKLFCRSHAIYEEGQQSKHEPPTPKIPTATKMHETYVEPNRNLHSHPKNLKLGNIQKNTYINRKYDGMKRKTLEFNQVTKTDKVWITVMLRRRFSKKRSDFELKNFSEFFTIKGFFSH